MRNDVNRRRAGDFAEQDAKTPEPAGLVALLAGALKV
jgi:hypothetical protein